MSNRDLHTGVLQYRPDVDGLRAVAVLSVVLFHIRDSLVPGGFVGVDIFFVISGFLITSIIHREMSQGRFSFGAFYARRIRRIAPAYLAVTLATLLAGALLLLPQDLAALGRSALWSAFSLPNVYFWLYLDTSYFAPASDQIPLLHLWSLGVEEQFYLLWPALLLLVWRLHKSWLLLGMVVAAAVSFAYAQQMAIEDPSFAYYMLPTRAGELLLGATVALLPLRRLGGTKFVAIAANEVIVLIGYALVGWSLVGLDGESPFPGINAVYPCLGTALLIAAGGQRASWLTAPLRWKPMIWIGLISYSLYLWHWPVLAFVRYFMTTIDTATGIICLGVILLVSWLSYRFIEVPFRLSKRAETRARPLRSALVVYGLSVGGLAAICSAIVYSDGLKPLIAPDGSDLARRIQAVGDGTKAALSYPYNCQSSKLRPENFRLAKCVMGPNGPGPGNNPRAILIGDSNAAHFVGMFGAIAHDRWFSFRNVTVSSCPPIFGAPDRYGSKSRNRECTRYRKAIEQQVKPYDLVLLGGQWGSYSNQSPHFASDLDRTVQKLTRSGKQVVIMGLVPRFPNYDRGCELRRARMRWVDCQARAAEKGKPNAMLNRKLAGIARKHPGAYYMDITDVVCPAGRCAPYLDSTPIYYDPGHLSMAGSWLVGESLVGSGVPLRPVFRRVAKAELRNRK